jgi:molybdopterin converting factor subunit 1
VIVEVKLFAAARQLAGAEVLHVELAEGATVGELRQAILEKCPSLSPLMASSMIAVEQDYARNESKLPRDAEIALIPPVSGG